MEPAIQRHLEWLQNLIAVNEGMTKAQEVFVNMTDKRLATMAAYKAMGLDPRDAPDFGLGLLATKQAGDVTTVISQGVQPAPAPEPPKSPETVWMEQPFTFDKNGKVVTGAPRVAADQKDTRPIILG